MKSTRWTVSAYQWAKGLILAVGSPLLIYAQSEIPNWGPWLTAHFGSAGPSIQIALGILVAYIGKSFVTDDTKVAIKTLAKQDVTVIDNSNTIKN